MITLSITNFVAESDSWELVPLSKGTLFDTRDIISATICASTVEYTVNIISKVYIYLPRVTVDRCHFLIVTCISLPIQITFIPDFEDEQFGT